MDVPTNQVITQNIIKDVTLLNATQLANMLGVNNNYITRMKASGFHMPGGRSTVQDALDWRKENPKYGKQHYGGQ